MAVITGTLSQDEAKILTSLLNQLTYSPKDAAFILPILDKLEAFVTEPGLASKTVTLTSNQVKFTDSKLKYSLQKMSVIMLS